LQSQGHGEFFEIGQVLRDHLQNACSGVLKPGSVALVDFPDFGNVGDSAIWIGERQILRHIGIQTSYTCSVDTYDPYVLSRFLKGSGTVLLSGGGNFGDLWPRHQELREDIAKRFPRTRLVQLPQSIHFKSVRNLQEAVSVFAKHDDFHLLIRDRAGLPLAQTISGGRASLSPDAAFQLRPGRRQPAEVDLLFLLRHDQEGMDYGAIPVRQLGDLRWEAADWPADPLTPGHEAGRLRRALKVRARRGRRRIVRGLSARHSTAGVAAWQWDRMAHQRLLGGLQFLQLGRVVITDRLHGHILCLITGIPHVFLDNNYGKVSSFARTWGTESEFARAADSLEEAVGLARHLLLTS